jgi:hypothetical protein
VLLLSHSSYTRLEAELSPQVANIKLGIAVKVVGVEDGIEGRNERQAIV